MLLIKLSKNSLLYGESFFWLVTSLFVPFFWLPDLVATKHHHAVLDLPHASELISLYTRAKDSRLIRLVWSKLVIVTQIFYLASFFIVGIAFQRGILESFGIYQTDSLTYRTLYYTPTVFRLDVLLISAITLAHIHCDVWIAYDKADFFAVDERFQRKVIFLSLLSIIPDCFFNITETIYILSFIKSSNFVKRLDLFEGERWSAATATSLAVDLLFVGLSTVNVILRYKPILDLIYLSACVRKHLERINGQIQPAGMAAEANKLIYNFNRDLVVVAAAADDDDNDDDDDDDDDKLQAVHDAVAAPSKRPRRSLDNSVAIAIYQNATSNLLELRQIMRAKTRLAHSRQPGGRQLEEDSAGEQLISLTSLQQFERHLTQVQLFVNNADRRAPATVLSLILLNSMGFFYIILYTIRIEAASGLINLISLINLLARSMPLLSLFLLGHQLERERRQLIHKLEVVYLQEQSHSLIYKQLLDAQYSLARAFKLLELIKFDCNGLLDLNLKTLTKCVVYVCGSIFIVLQYDLLIFT